MKSFSDSVIDADTPLSKNYFPRPQHANGVRKMTEHRSNDLTKLTVDDLRLSAYNAMAAASQQVLSDRIRDAVNAEETAASKRAEERQRAAKIMSGISEAICKATKWTLESPFPLIIDGFSCQTEIMALEPQEYSLSPGYPDEDDWHTRFRERGILSGAAKDVFDCCEQAGLHPTVDRRITYGDGPRSSATAYFLIKIRWNIPRELTIKRH
jgi:hypothetical protein